MHNKDFETVAALLRELDFDIAGDDGVCRNAALNLIRSTTGTNAAALQTLRKAFAAAGLTTLDAMHGQSASRVRQIALGTVCLKLAFGGLCAYLRNNPAFVEVTGIFEELADPDYYNPAVCAQMGANDQTGPRMALFMQGFYNFIADTGHVVTPGHMAVFNDMLAAADRITDVCVSAETLAVPGRWQMRRQNRQIIKRANAGLLTLCPAYPFRVFQQDYDEAGELAVNATAYHDFDGSLGDFVLDCRLESDAATDTLGVTLVLFCRRDKDRFADVFNSLGFAPALGFAFEPEHKWFVRREFTGISLNDAETAAGAITDSAACLIRQLPL